MTASRSTRWIPSSKRNPCPICGRTKDGDCRTSGDGLQVICHHPKDHRPGEVIDGHDGAAWAYTGATTDGRGGCFTLDKPRDGRPQPRKVVPIRRQPPAPAPAPITGPIRLARLQTPIASTGSPYAYGPTQRVQRIDTPEGKRFRCEHHDGQRWAPGAGPDPWPAWHQDHALGADGWVLELEGEKCCSVALAAGLVAITQPGHAHKPEQIQTRYQQLQTAGVPGVVFISDHDAEGAKRASQAATAAAAVGLPFLHLPASTVWPGLPPGGSIDDAPGSPADRVADIERAVAAALQPQTVEVTTDHLPAPQDRPEQDREPTTAERITDSLEALLRATLQDDLSEIDAGMADLWRLGVSRERSQERVLYLWAERNGYQLSPGAGPSHPTGRVFGRAKESAGLRHQLPGFIIDKDLHLLVSTASGGKTLAAAELAVVMSARDRGFLDHEEPRSDPPDDPRRTVLVIASDGEGSAYAMWEDYLQLVGAEERGARVEIWAQDDETGERSWNVSLRNLDRLAQRLATGDVAMVIADTANAILRGAGINAGVGPIETYLRLLKQIVCRRCALLITHHTNRGASADMKGIGGHPAFQEVPAVVHMIEAKEQADGTKLRVWHVLKLRSTDYRRFAYTLQEGRLRVTEGHVFENCTQQVLVALHTQTLLKAGTAPGDLIAITKRPAQSVYNALNQLRSGKLVRQHGKGYRLTPSGQAVVDSLRV